MMPRLFAVAALLLCLAIAASCTMAMNRFVMANRGEQDAKIILQGMKQVPLRPGDQPVTIQPE